MKSELEKQLATVTQQLERWATDPSRRSAERADLTLRVFELAWDLLRDGQLIWSSDRTRKLTFESLELDRRYSSPSRDHAAAARRIWCQRLTGCLDAEGADELLDELDLVSSRYVTSS